MLLELPLAFDHLREIANWSRKPHVGVLRRPTNVLRPPAAGPDGNTALRLGLQDKSVDLVEAALEVDSAGVEGGAQDLQAFLIARAARLHVDAEHPKFVLAITHANAEDE